MTSHASQTGLGRGLARAALLALLLAAGCSQPRPESRVTLVLPTRLSVATTDVAGVYDTVARYIADTGLVPDVAQSGRAKSIFVSQRARCAPNGDERHTAWCVFSFSLAQPPENPATVAVTVRVRAQERIAFDPKYAADQIRIEPTLDRLVTELRNRFGRADVVLSDTLSF